MLILSEDSFNVEFTFAKWNLPFQLTFKYKSADDPEYNRDIA